MLPLVAGLPRQRQHVLAPYLDGCGRGWLRRLFGRRSRLLRAAGRQQCEQLPEFPLTFCFPCAWTPSRVVPFRSALGQKKQKSSYAVFSKGLTIGYELHPQSEPSPSRIAFWKSRRSACSQSWSACRPDPSPLVLFNQDVIRCQRCTRLRKYCEEIATSKRRAYRDWIYWAKPVPSFGDENARVC